MICSNSRKRCLSGWLRQNSRPEYDALPKLQNFLLLYECFSKVSGETPDFGHLKGCRAGPVFSQVWEDYTKEKASFDSAAAGSYRSNGIAVNEGRAKKCSFVVKILSESELSELTHSMNLWKSREDRIMGGEYQVDLDEGDFNADDVKIITALDKMYPIELIENSSVIAIGNQSFVIHKNDVPRLTGQHFGTLSSVAEKGRVPNPAYVEIDGSGRLAID